MNSKLAINHYTCSRIEAILEIIRNVESGDFPYTDSKLVLNDIKEKLNKASSRLKLANDRSDPKFIKKICKNIYKELHKELPKIGFILRSTEPRNNFEVYPPLKRLSHELINDTILLVISSEWEYSPKITTENNKLLVGMPASESTNPFLIPLAGHELGHAIWGFDSTTRLVIRNKLSEVRKMYEDSPQLNNDIYKVISRCDGEELTKYSLFERAEKIANRKVEELFCDTIAIALFGSSYIEAFSYLVSPYRPDSDMKYPDFCVRLSSMEVAMEAFKVSTNFDIHDLFDEVGSSVKGKSGEIVIADILSNSVVSDIVESVKHILEEKKINPFNQENVGRISESFKKYIPYSGDCSLFELLIAGWEVYKKILYEVNEDESEISEKDYKTEFEDLGQSVRITILKEIILKSIEILEYNWKVNKEYDS